MKNGINKLLLTGLITVFLAGSAHAVDAGGKLPDVRRSVPQWFGWNPDEAVRKQDNNAELDVVMFFDPAAANSAPYLQLLSGLQEMFAESHPGKVRISAVSRGSVRETKSFWKSAGPYAVPVGADDQHKLYLEIARQEPVLPLAVVAGKGVVQWVGNPTDLESVIGRILNGTFSYSTQLKADALRHRLQAAIQSSLPDVIQRTADEILRLLPGDMIAIQSKLYVYQASGKSAEALAFIRERTEQAPAEVNLRIMYLDILLRNGRKQEFREALEKAVQDNAGSKDGKLRLLVFTLENAPFGTIPLRTVLKLAQNCEAGYREAKPARKALTLELLARANYMMCDAQSAVRYQRDALAQRKGTRLEKAAEELLEYYQIAAEKPKQKEP